MESGCGAWLPLEGPGNRSAWGSLFSLLALLNSLCIRFLSLYRVSVCPR